MFFIDVFVSMEFGDGYLNKFDYGFMIVVCLVYLIF